jgi:hypothetical protein
MGFQVRRVPQNWNHPRNEKGEYVPMKGISSDEPKTHLQGYETITEGTPVTPVFSCAEELARWCADNIGGVNYERWLASFDL